MTEPTVVDVVEFHRVVLPARLAAGTGELAAREAEAVGPIAFVTPVGAWTYRGVDGTVTIVDGVDDRARVVVELDEEAFAGLAADLETPVALLYQQRASVTRGNPLRFVRWEPALRAMFHGRPIYDPDAVDLRDRSGAPLDPSTAYRFDEVTFDPGGLAHHLSTVGFVVVRDVFTPSDVAALRRAAEELRDEAVPGDRASWWGRTASGEAVVTRVLNGITKPALRGLVTDHRVRLLADATGLELRASHANEVDGVTVLWKLPDVVEGLADLPWHRDCGMGGHAVNCPTIVMSICLTDGGPQAGELRALPGSHTTGHPFIDGTAEGAPLGVPLDVRAGDVSLHHGDVMHASLPPTSAVGPHRVSVLLAFAPATAGHHRGGRHYNDALLANDDGQVEHLGHRLGPA